MAIISQNLENYKYSESTEENGIVDVNGWNLLLESFQFFILLSLIVTTCMGICSILLMFLRNKNNLGNVANSGFSNKDTELSSQAMKCTDLYPILNFQSQDTTRYFGRITQETFQQKWTKSASNNNNNNSNSNNNNMYTQPVMTLPKIKYTIQQLLWLKETACNSSKDCRNRRTL